MHIGNRLFPYPVLNSQKLYSQYSGSSFNLKYDESISEDNQYYILNNIYCELTDEYLIQLIKEGKAGIKCIVECPKTMFRRMYSLPLEPTSIAISLTDLNDKVSISAFIIAIQDIPDFRNKGFLEDYQGFGFEIEKHDILAADDGFVNKIEFEQDDNKQNSIFVIIKDTAIKDGSMQVDYDYDNIVISLPEKEWNLYDKTKRISKYESVYFSMIAVPALAYALSELKKDDPSVDELELDYRWFNSFAEAYKKYHGSDLDDSAFSKMNTNLEAQYVLNTPVTKAIEQIFSFAINSMGGSDDAD